MEINTPLKIEPEYQDSYNAWKKEPNNATRGQFLQSIDPLINKYIGSVSASNRDLIRTQAQTIAIKSLDRYNPDVSNLNTFLGQQFMGLRRKTRQQDPANIIRQPEHIQLMQQRLYEAQENLTDSLGRVPSTAELADRTGIPLNTINRIKKRQQSVNSGSLVVDSDDGPNSGLPSIKHNISLKAQADYVYNELGPTDQFIFEHSEGFAGLFNNSEMSNSQLAVKTGLSLASISQRKAKIQQILEQARSAF